MNKHVVSLELAKRLKEAGYPQESEFVWIFRESMYADRHYEVNRKNEWQLIPRIKEPTDTCGEQVAAPLATELLEQLPITTKITVKLSINSGSRGYIVQYDKFEIGKYSLPDALAEMYLYLNENNLL